MEEKLYQTIKNYTDTVKSFHMPGHKNAKVKPIEDLLCLDVTEVEGTDDLHHPTGVIGELQNRIARVYQSGASHLLVNGSTAGILSAVSGVTGPGDRVLIGRNCHKSVYNAALLNQLGVDYVYPEPVEEVGVYGCLNPESVDQELNACGGTVRAVIITSPTYEGIMSDVEAIAKVVHRHGAVLIVDEAHGAHFAFSAMLPQSALELGADIVIHSTHKTLPCLTQTGLLHISGEALESGRVSDTKVQRYLSIYQTSSPSYVLMCSIEQGIEYMLRNGDSYHEQIESLVKLRENHKSSYGRWLTGCGYEMDPTRMTYVVEGMTGWEYEKKLRERYSIQVELSDERHFVAITSIADSVGDIVELMDAVEAIGMECSTGGQDDGTDLGNAMKPQGSGDESKSVQSDGQQRAFDDFRPLLRHSVSEVMEMTSAKVPLKEATGKVAGAFIIPYPPGIPLVVPGEVLDEELIGYLEYLISNDNVVYGIIEGETTIVVED